MTLSQGETILNWTRVALRLIPFLLIAGVVFLPQGLVSQGQDPQTQTEEAVPAFHAEAPRGTLPETLSPEQFTNVIAQNAYALAARVKKVLYQQPCYCHCDRSRGHASLLDCFTSQHAAECGVCIREGIYSYEQSRKGKSATQIRDGIEHGEWQHVDLSRYQTPPASK